MDKEELREGEALFLDWIDGLSVEDRRLVTEFLIYDLSHERSVVDEIRRESSESTVVLTSRY